MSGGHFNLTARDLENLSEELGEIPMYNRPGQEDYYDFSGDTLERIAFASKLVYIAAKMLERVDYLVCGDDSEETFHKLWEDEVSPLLND